MTRKIPQATPLARALLGTCAVLAMSSAFAQSTTPAPQDPDSQQVPTPTSASTPTGTHDMSTASGPVTVRSLPPDSISSNYHVDFATIDTNGNGSLSRTEVQASGNQDLMREFTVVDANHNGSLSVVEMKSWTD
jgi:hypothetical protein